MKRTGIILLASLSLVLQGNRPIPDYEDNLQLFYEGQLVNIYLYKELYVQQGSKAVYFRFQVRNRTTKQIGFDLDDYWGVLFPNHWIIMPSGRYGESLERLQEYEALDETAKEHLNWRLTNELIRIIPAKGSVEYLRDFSRITQKDIKLRKGQTLTVSFDGQLLITDGSTVEDVNCFDEEKVQRQLEFVYPLKYEAAPGNVFVIKEK